MCGPQKWRDLIFLLGSLRGNSGITLKERNQGATDTLEPTLK